MANKKRQRKWNIPKQVKNRMKRIKGESYVTRKGIVKSAKPFVHSECSCLNRCIQKITEEDRRNMRDEFRGGRDTKDQRQFIDSLIDRKSTIKNKTQRQYCYTYYLKNYRGEKCQVCLPFFCDTFGMSKRTIQSWATKKFPSEMSSKNAGRPSSRTKDLKDVFEFFDTYKFYETHYGRAKNSDKKYLAPGVTGAKFYEHYVDHCSKNGRGPTVTLHHFHQIVRFDTTIQTKNLQVDTCKFCDEFIMQLRAAKTDEEKTHIELERNKHYNAVERTQSLYDMEANLATAEHPLITFDLQKVLNLPVLTTSASYYKHSFSTYNFGIHPTPLACQVSMYYWTEVHGNRGAIEISSCLVHYLRKNYSASSSLTLFADRCGAQNRNIKIVLALLRHLSDPSVKTESITLYYFVSGHSRMNCDRDFGKIEHKIKQVSEVHLPEEYVQIIGSCTENPFDVKVMNNEDFYSTDNLESVICNRKYAVDSEGNKVKINWMKISCIELRKTEPFSIFVKESLDQIEFLTIDIKKNNAAINTLFDVIPKKAYPSKLKISKEKKADLISLLPYMPVEKHKFYETLPT